MCRLAALLMKESYRDCSQKKRALLDCHLCVQTNQACNCEVVLLFVVCSCEFFRARPASARLLARCVRASRATCRRAALRRVAACQPGVAASCVWPFCTLMSKLRAWKPFVKSLHPIVCCFAARLRGATTEHPQQRGVLETPPFMRIKTGIPAR